MHPRAQEAAPILRAPDKAKYTENLPAEISIAHLGHVHLEGGMCFTLWWG